MNKKIKTNVFARIRLVVPRDHSLSLTTNYIKGSINQLSIDNFERVLIEDVLASVSFICSSSVIVSVE